MQEENKNASTVKFLSVFGMKVVDGEKYNPDDDTTDQRAPVNNPEALYEQFVVPQDVMDELDRETVDDFDDDIYPYEDRTELGEDIAMMASLNLEKSQDNLRKAQEKKSESKPADDAGDDAA